MQKHLPKTNRYWFIASMLAFLIFLLPQVVLPFVEGKSLSDIQLRLENGGALFFLLSLTIMGTFGLVFGGSSDARNRGGSYQGSFTLGCLGAVAPLFILSTGDGPKSLIKAFLVIFVSCTGLEVAALFEKEPVRATPFVALVVIALTSAVVMTDPLPPLLALGLLLLQQAIFSALRYRIKTSKLDTSMDQSSL